MVAEEPRTEPLLRTDAVSKSYVGIEVLHEVSLDIKRGEVLGLVGENGAGKSTILSLITGMTAPSSGTIHYDGRQIATTWSPKQARLVGIGAVHQELSLNPHQTVAENVFLGNWPVRRGVATQRSLEKAAQPFLDEVGLTVSPADTVATLTLGEMQLLELAKALVSKPTLLILDEVTSALDDSQVENVFRVVRRLCAEGGAVVIVTHRMSELFAICDRLTVLKDGAYVATRARAETTEDDIVQLMLGRALSAIFPPKSADAAAGVAPLLRVRDLSVPRAVHGVSFELRPGTITGLGGLQGQGQSEVLRALFGLAAHTGQIEFDGKPVTISAPRHAISNRIIYVPEDRKVEGVDVGLSVAANLQLPNIPLLAPLRRLGTVNRRAGRDLVAEMIAKLQIKARPTQEVRRLSGGNQQKVALAKWLPTEPRVLLLAEPTRGIDVGTKREIYRLLRQFADDGLAILVTSGDTLELIGLCDEIAVMYEGRIVERLQGEKITEEALVHASVIVKESEPDVA
ncbi:sugar ABC transporter ATP-binding protein [Glaciibacter psychrotolerans]|uniref:Ribose transport system ATP-binding protein n=1 Tax=Glaciibacter psychrotolerans TaxID=670054 RepID=A0A7Z0EGL4_9MICO|nr:sugar ABC transporter ATP-binding protein [Leifsonia psychrotolerans]NYJ21297.1 ribose transport system ATP-binding protein [Leifsonia psychrotolerans]